MSKDARHQVSSSSSPLLAHPVPRLPSTAFASCTSMLRWPCCSVSRDAQSPKQELHLVGQLLGGYKAQNANVITLSIIKADFSGFKKLTAALSAESSTLRSRIHCSSDAAFCEVINLAFLYLMFSGTASSSFFHLILMVASSRRLRPVPCHRPLCGQSPH